MELKESSTNVLRTNSEYRHVVATRRDAHNGTERIIVGRLETGSENPRTKKMRQDLDNGTERVIVEKSETDSEYPVHYGVESKPG